MKRSATENRATATGLTRQAQVVRGSLSKSNRTVEIALSSEYPVQREGYVEILSHNPGDIDLTRLNDSAPFLLNHDVNSQVGVVEPGSARLGADKTLRCTVRLGTSQRAEEIFQDIISGIRKHISCGYEHTSELSTGRDAQGVPVVRFAWRVYECSSVPLPADPTVGVGRAIRARVDAAQDMAECWCAKCGWKGTWLDAKEDRCPRCNAKAVDEEHPHGRRLSASEFQAELAKLSRNTYMRQNQTVARTKLFGLSEVDAQEFSIVRAIRDTIQGSGPTGFEREMLEEGRKQYPSVIEGQVFVPPDLMVGLGRNNPLFRDLNVTTSTQGGNLVQTTVLTPIVEFFRNKLVTQRAGIQILAGLQGNIAIPRQTGAATAYTLAEQGTVTKSTQVINQIAMTPHRVGATNSYTKQLLLQSSVDVEDFVRDDLMKVRAIKIDYLVLQGKGGTDPVGISQTTDVGSLTFGGRATWQSVINFETALALANADIGRMAYIIAPEVRGMWKTILKIPTGTVPIFIWESSVKWPDAEGEVNGYRAYSTKQIDLSQVVFGNWEDDILGMWGGLDIVADPYCVFR